MADFRAAYPEYVGTSKLDELRATEYSYLDERGDVYLDFTGTGIAAGSVIAAVFVNRSSYQESMAAATTRMAATLISFADTVIGVVVGLAAAWLDLRVIRPRMHQARKP
jgi:hypothetical protein